MKNTSELYDKVIDILKEASTGMIVDAMVISRIKVGIRGIRSARGFEDRKIIGKAVTVLYSSPNENAEKLNHYQIIRDSPPGSVLVIDGKKEDAHYTGDNQGECAKIQGFEGIVVYGGARDLHGFREIDMPIYCTGSAVRYLPAERLQLSAYNVPIDIGGVIVNPGDIIVGDEDGVVAIPSESMEILLKNMEIIFEVEQGMEKAIKRKAPLDEIATVISKKKPK